MQITRTDKSYFHTYSDGTKVIHTGERMKIGQNAMWARNWAGGWPFINLIKHANVSSVNNVGTTDAKGYFDISAADARYNLVCAVGTVWIDGGDYVLRWTGTGDATLNGGAEVGAVGTNTKYLVDGQDETSYDNSPTTEGTFTAGTGHDVNDVITLASGAAVTVDAVSGGAVTEFTVDSSGQSTNSGFAAADNQSNSTGTGTGFALTPDEDNIVNRKVYTVAEGLTTSAFFVQVTGPGTCTEIALIAPDNEARYDDGKIMNQKWIDAFSGISTFRVLQWLGVSSTTNEQELSDYKPYDWISWISASSLLSDPPYGAAPPIRVYAEACNELGCNLMFPVPHSLTDQGQTDVAGVLNTYYTVPGGKVYVHFDNECWNTAYVGYYYTFYAHAPDGLQETSAFNTSTVSATCTGHNLVDGDQIRCFGTLYHDDFPYAGGGRLWVIVDDANTFRAAPSAPITIDNITQANPGVVTTNTAHGYVDGDVVRIYGCSGMTEVNGNDYTVANSTSTTFELSGTNTSGFGAHTQDTGSCLVDATDKGATPDSDVDGFRFFKQTSGGVAQAGQNFGNLSVNAWDNFKAVLGDKCIRVLDCREASAANYLDYALLAPGCREKLDYAAPAAYMYSRNPMDDANDPPYRYATTAQITSYLRNESTDDRTDPNFEAHITSLGHKRIMTYEGGIHDGPFTKEYPVNAQDETDYDGSGNNGTFNGGSDYSVNDVITLDNLVEITVNAVSGGVVTEFTVDGTTTGEAHNSGSTFTQDSVTPSGGSGFTITPGDNNVDSSGELGTSATAVQKCDEWDQSNDGLTFHQWYWQKMATLGYKEVVHYISQFPFDAPDQYGFKMMENFDDLETNQYVTCKAHWDDGGAPKFKDLQDL